MTARLTMSFACVEVRVLRFSVLVVGHARWIPCFHDVDTHLSIVLMKNGQTGRLRWRESFLLSPFSFLLTTTRVTVAAKIRWCFSQRHPKVLSHTIDLFTHLDNDNLVAGRSGFGGEAPSPYYDAKICASLVSCTTGHVVYVELEWFGWRQWQLKAFVVTRRWCCGAGVNRSRAAVQSFGPM